MGVYKVHCYGVCLCHVSWPWSRAARPYTRVMMDNIRRRNINHCHYIATRHWNTYDYAYLKPTSYADSNSRWLLPRPRRGLRGIVFTRSVCLCVCLSVCVCVCLCVRPIFGILFLGYQKRYRSEIYTGYLYSCTQFNEKYWPSYVKGQGHWDGSLLFKGAVISQKLGHRKISIFFHRHLLAYSIRWNNKN